MVHAAALPALLALLPGFALAAQRAPPLEETLASLPTRALCGLLEGAAPDGEDATATLDEGCPRLAARDLARRVVRAGAVTTAAALQAAAAAAACGSEGPGPRHVCVLDTEIEAGTARHPSELAGWARCGGAGGVAAAWSDFSRLDAARHWARAEWFVADATVRGAPPPTGRRLSDSVPRRVASLPRCEERLRSLPVGLDAEPAEMRAGAVRGVFVDFHGQLLGPTAPGRGGGTLLYHDFYAQLHVQVLYYIILYHSTLYYMIALHYIILCYIILYYIILYDMI